MNRDQIAYFRTEDNNGSLSWGELADIQGTYEATITDPDAERAVAVSDMLDEIEAALDRPTQSQTVRYLLVEVTMPGTADPESTLDDVQYEIVDHLHNDEGSILDGLRDGNVTYEVTVSHPAKVETVNPFDAVADLNCFEALRVATSYATRARASLDDEREIDFKANVAELLAVAAKLDAFAKGM